MRIIGSGLAACIAGIYYPDSEIVYTGDIKPHKAILRLRTSKLAELARIKMKKLKIYKGIFHRGNHVQPNTRLAILYSRKVTNTASPRSILNIDPVERYIPPKNLHEILLSRISNRLVKLDSLEEAINYDGPIISTIPMDVMLNVIGKDIHIKREKFPIYVTRMIIQDCDFYATNYYTDPETWPYRASLDGDVLIIESRYPIFEHSKPNEQIYTVFKSFGLDGMEYKFEIKDYKQEYGKITPIDEDVRKSIIWMLTKEFRIYSLGRFATWRNILIDDVIDDIKKIDNMINQQVEI